MKSASGSIRKKTQTIHGKEYTHWEARVTVGHDPVTGKQIQRTFTGKTQKEVRQKMTAATAQLDAGTYQAPAKMTLSQWLETWSNDYLKRVKPLTVTAYKGIIRNHITPALGEAKISTLTNVQIQKFYSRLYDTLSPKTVKDVHGVLHRALSQAVKSGLLSKNPADGCELERVENPKLEPLDGSQIASFLDAIKGHQFQNLYTVILLLGLREGEALGLTWDNVNFETRNVTIDKQLLSGTYVLAPTKNSGVRTITASSTAIQALQAEKLKQMELRMKLGSGWDPSGLVFTNEKCEHLCHVTVYKAFKKIAAQIGCPNARLHDLRHSFAVMSLQAGDDIKTVQQHLGHATAAFTLDLYCHVTKEMQQDSADRQEAYLKKVKSQ